MRFLVKVFKNFVESVQVSSNFCGMHKVISTIFLFILLTEIVFGRRWDIVSTTDEALIVDIQFDVNYPADMEPEYITVGLPIDEFPEIATTFSTDKTFNFDVLPNLFIGAEWVSKQIIHSLHTATLRISPFAGGDKYYSKVRITFHMGETPQKNPISLSKLQQGFLRHTVINWDIAQHWIFAKDGLFKTTETGSEHLIIGPSEFESSSLPLVIHRGNSRYVHLDSIYTQFNNGNPTPEAIREFILWAHDTWETPPICILLMGDIEWIPTLYYSGDYAADDLFTSRTNDSPPIAAIGRYPAHNTTDVEAFVSKLIEYEVNPVFGPWRQRITLVADDAARPEHNINEVLTGKSHTLNSELVAGRIPDLIDVQKIYMMEYPEVSNASAYGVIKPDATDALFSALRNGTAIINYIGHGDPTKWAQEQLLSKNRGDIHSIQTGMKLPIWIAGTCSWGHFDDPHTDAFSEDIIREPENGAAAIITTSRAIGISSNAHFLQNIFSAIFPDGQPTNDPIGIVLQSVKTGSYPGRLFHLFGDPAMPLPFPTGITSVDSLSTDTLITLEPARYYGSQPFDQNGTGYVSLTEGNRLVTRHYTIAGSNEEISYFLPGPSLFRGQFRFTDDQFTGELIVPKDISDTENPGNLRVYLLSDNGREAMGAVHSIYYSAGGTNTDTEGPIIQFTTSDGRYLQTGDHLTPEESLILTVSDLSGINLTEEIGHEIMLTNITRNLRTDLTHQFVYDVDKITSGTITIPLDDFNTEIHMNIKVWDNANNPSEREIRLTRSESTQLNVFQVLNFPNPFRTGTQFAFEISSPADVKINVYTLGGKRIYSTDNFYFPNAGYHTIDWDGRDAYGQLIANGVYLYRLKATDLERSVSVIERMAKFR